tara:strand:- start:11643 stop:12548 length:906 start_codon:yes stop_codon:yes gene_type:complete
MRVEIVEGFRQDCFSSVDFVPALGSDKDLLRKAKVARLDARVSTSGWAVTNLLHLENSVENQFWEQHLHMGKISGALFDPWALKWWDLHRRISDDFSDLSEDVRVARFSEFVIDFIREYGELVTPSFKKQTLKDWFTEFGEISHVVGALHEIELIQNEANVLYSMTQVETMSVQVFARRSIEAAVVAKDQKAEELRQNLCKVVGDDLTDSTGIVAQKLKKYTSLDVSKNDEMSMVVWNLQPLCLAGWLWALIARDLFNGITYQRCDGNRSDETNCIREVPSIAPNGENVRHCLNCKDEEKV